MELYLEHGMDQKLSLYQTLLFSWNLHIVNPMHRSWMMQALWVLVQFICKAELALIELPLKNFESKAIFISDFHPTLVISTL